MCAVELFALSAGDLGGVNTRLRALSRNSVFLWVQDITVCMCDFHAVCMCQHAQAPQHKWLPHPPNVVKQLLFPYWCPLRVYTDSYKWSSPEVSGESPPPLAAHGCAVVGNMLYIFGGLGTEGVATDQLYALNTGTPFLPHFTVYRQVWILPLNWCVLCSIP